MIKEEKISRAIALERVKYNLLDLSNSGNELKDIFHISFKHENYTLFNVMGVASYKDISYGEAKAKICEFANFISETIPTNEKIIGIDLDNSPEWIYSFYAILMSGRTPALLNHRNSETGTSKICSKLNVNYVIGDRTLSKNVKIINPKDIKSNNKVELDNWADEVIFLSSGTSGEEKIIYYSGKQFAEQIKNGVSIVDINKYITKGYKGYLKHLVVLPFYHVFGFIAVFLWFSFFNVTFVLPMNLSNKAIQQACLLAKPTHIFAVPLFWNTIEKEINATVKENNIEKKFKKGINLSYKLQKSMPKLGLFIAKKILFGKYLDQILGKSIQFCISGGSFISSDTLKTINVIGYPLSNGYGSTEIGITSFCNDKNISKRISGSIGKPFGSVSYSIKENENKIKELYVKGDSIAKKIVNGDGIIENVIEINTHDSCNMIDDEFYLSGRTDEIVILNNGENFSLPELEASIKIEHANDALLIKNENEDKFDLIISYPEMISSAKLKEDQISIKNILSKSIIKNVYLTFYHFPKANDIKIKRFEVINYFKNNPDKFFNFDKYLVDIDKHENKVNEQLLAKIVDLFNDYFNVKDVKENSNFYTDLGGDSLGYFMLISKICESLHVEIKPSVDMPQTPIEFAIFISRISK